MANDQAAAVEKHGQAAVDAAYKAAGVNDKQYQIKNQVPMRNALASLGFGQGDGTYKAAGTTPAAPAAVLPVAPAPQVATSPAAPQPQGKPTTAQLRTAAVFAFGAGHVEVLLANAERYGRTEQFALEQRFWQSGLTFPGQSDGSEFDQTLKLPRPYGLGRAVHTKQQDSINKFFNTQK